MELLWFGHSCFRLRGREATVVTDPPEPSLGYALGKLQPDVVTVSHDHAGHNYAAICSEECRVVAGPGEYEIAGVFLTGVETYHDAEGGKLRGKNTAYAIAIDELTICHLGDLGHVPTAKLTEDLGNIDVLLLPVGGRNTINGAQAAELIALLGAKIVVPMHYRTAAAHTAELDPVERFLKEMGRGELAPQPKLTVTRSSLPAETQVVLLEPAGVRGGGGR